MKKLNILSILFLASFLFVFSSCGDDDDPIVDTGDDTLVELVQGNDDLSSLLAALQRADLVGALSGTDPLTVFAPDNAAFDRFLSANNFNSLDDVPADALRQVLLNHVVSGNVLSTDLTTGYAPSLSTELTTSSAINLYVNTSGGVTLNGQSAVTTANIAAENGTVHLVDEVILPASLVTYVGLDPSFSTLLAALTRPSFGATYTDLLSGSQSAPFTVFAPTNDAFGNLLTLLGANSLDDIDDSTLQTVLNYHVLAGSNVRASALTNGLSAATFQGEEITFDLTSGAQIMDGSDMLSNIVETDNQSANGVIHRIDKVLLPQVIYDAINPTIAGFVAMNSDYSSLLAAVERAGLVDVLASDESNLTVLAPNNQAFNSFLSANGFNSLEEVPVDLLTQVLLNHVIDGEVFSSALTTGYGSTLATNADGDNLNIYINTAPVVNFNGGASNGGASVTAADVDVRNGVIHAVDAVINLPTVVTFAIADNTFSTLVSALTRSDHSFDFVGTLSTTDSPAPFTVFAPTNDAFGDLLTELSAPDLGAIDIATLDAVLRYHVVVNANVRAIDLSDNMEVSTFNGEALTINLSSGSGVTITDARNRVSDIIVTDVQASNGVIHVLNKVILP